MNWSRFYRIETFFNETTNTESFQPFYIYKAELIILCIQMHTFHIMLPELMKYLDVLS